MQLVTVSVKAFAGEMATMPTNPAADPQYAVVGIWRVAHCAIVPATLNGPKSDVPWRKSCAIEASYVTCVTVSVPHVELATIKATALPDAEKLYTPRTLQGVSPPIASSKPYPRTSIAPFTPREEPQYNPLGTAVVTQREAVATYETGPETAMPALGE